eukprot:25630-Eustigmatos_ZCMA.PRE.1
MDRPTLYTPELLSRIFCLHLAHWWTEVAEAVRLDSDPPDYELDLNGPWFKSAVLDRVARIRQTQMDRYCSVYLGGARPKRFGGGGSERDGGH